ncbi:MAG: tRNA (N6-threonylcarbamoyladenosine(37)-N6)-methyltransferase TrmO [Deltaproteobacteria bacterium]|nr:tRNA (N6-threonylcarbamoyladenosine(37)-N6)-methyltransferase TrmO [Deltaproteobacteria bacterium]
MSTPPAPPPTERGPFLLEPIGWVCSPYSRRFGTPQQAAAFDSDAEAMLQLDPTRIPENALTDLLGIERIWVLSWLHRGGGWSPQVMPPRGDRTKRGLFATRAPDRPNPIGLSALKLIRIEGRCLHVRGIDLLDGTPILDVKPYVPYADAFPEAKAGWIDAVPRNAPQFARFQAAPSINAGQSSRADRGDRADPADPVDLVDPVDLAPPDTFDGSQGP